jgi:hypothetical protein
MKDQHKLLEIDSSVSVMESVYRHLGFANQTYVTGHLNQSAGVTYPLH